MDARMLRQTQMTYQQHHQQHQLLLNSNNRLAATAAVAAASGRNHYSNRQQQFSHHKHQQQQQQQHSAGAAPERQQFINQKAGCNSSGTSSGSENEEAQLQLQAAASTISSSSTAATKTTSLSQKAMLSHNKTSPQQQQHKQQQRHLNHNQQQQQQQQHRQAALQAHANKAALGGYSSSKGAALANDNMTTSSSSEHTIDDLHHLAHKYSGGQHRLALAAAAASGGGGGRSGATTIDGSLASSSQSGSRFLLGVLFTLAELLLFTTVFLWLYWSYQHDDGLAWQNDRKQQFNTHAALMLLGFIFLNGQAMLIYRSFQCCSKIYTKILHTILFVLATSAISLGLILGFTAQDNVGASNKPIMHFYSLHAWVGLATVGLFALQFVFGFVSFLILLCCDTATSKFRAALLPIHKTFGLIIFSLAIATCLTGLLQTARSRLSSKLNKVDYHELGEAGIVINLIGVSLICLSILMPYIIRNLDIKRPSRSELLDRHLKLSQLDMRI